MFKTRLLSGIMLMAIAIVVIVFGGNVLFITAAVISFIGMIELYKIEKVHKALPGFVGYLAGFSYYALLYYERKEDMLLSFIIFLLLLMIVYVFRFPKYKTAQISIVYFGLFYVSIMLSYIYQVRELQDGAFLVWLIFIGAWGSDTCAYCVGMLIGKHKIAPKLSPKKSLEGCIGGVVGAALIGFIYATVFKDKITGIGDPQIAFPIIGAASSIISQIGDLAASAIKRNHDIKDYGNLIPGHGGILDRFDSIIFTAPIVYYLAEWL
ncbi:phosphatidate cytidylyltransferase [Mobilitalea sibirica]|uniref:Phosphatidate cytidylyltransferase n=1 Tax=Mobilitalea sibirica TaxID=1462919 RepID=A0A8J7KXN9_9FIRM|nr:phosphatidate cytidylyltransferase [Mobilitalea sibirica]MBH1942027.1 phosphatidate cytidylyltransferase [Mobilitalea sibirica]